MDLALAENLPRFLDLLDVAPAQGLSDGSSGSSADRSFRNSWGGVIFRMMSALCWNRTFQGTADGAGVGGVIAE